MSVRLGVNIDHVATIRQARGTHEPEPVAAALRMVIRWSGTEPKLRLMVEAKETALMNLALKSLELAARADLSLN